MIAEIDIATKLFRPLRLWERFARQRAAEIEQYGLAQLKKTLSMNYFNFALLGTLAQSFGFALWQWTKRPAGNPFAARMLSDPDAPRELKYAGWRAGCTRFTFFPYTIKRCGGIKMGFWERIEESRFGCFIGAIIEGQSTSQDLCNSTFECYSISRDSRAPDDRPMIEIGAGYGRLVYVFLKARPACQYWIFDLPPALYVALQYLSTVLSDRKVFAFRHFDTFDEVAAEVEASDFCFFSANQIQLLQDNVAGTFIAISNLHEMRREQINFYFGGADLVNPWRILY